MDQANLTGNGGKNQFRIRPQGPFIEAMEGRRMLSVSAATPPLADVTVAQGAASSTIELSAGFVESSPSTSLSYSVTSDSALVTPTVKNSTLTLKYDPANYGIAHVSVTATESSGGGVGGAGGGAGGSAIDDFVVTVTPQTNITIGVGGATLIHFPISADSTHHAGSGLIWLAGAGTAVVHFAGHALPQTIGKSILVSGNGDIAGVTITGSTAATKLAITTSSGARSILLGDVTADGTLGKLVARTTTLVGGLTLTGGIGAMSLGAGVGNTITIGSDATAAGLVSINILNAETIQSASSLRNLQTVAIQNSTVNITGNLGNFNFKSPRGTGAITGLNLSASGSITKLSIAGDLVNSILRSGGNIRSLTARSMSGSQIDAGIGILASGQTLPLTGDVASIAEIGQIVLRGGSGIAAFSNSVIAADRIGTATLTTIAGPNGGTPFGLAATRIDSLSGTVNGHSFRLSHLRTGADTHGLLVAQGADPSDFVVNML